MTGAEAEDHAAAFLQCQNLRLQARNYSCRFGEIDLIMYDGATLVFVEVRMRSSTAFGGAAASITPAKQARLIRTAQSYLAGMKPLPPCRFDAVLLSGNNDGIEWIRNAFSE